jgi:hypothetical protein
MSVASAIINASSGLLGALLGSASAWFLADRSNRKATERKALLDTIWAIEHFRITYHASCSSSSIFNRIDRGLIGSPSDESIQAHAVFESAEVSLQTQVIIINSLFSPEIIKDVVDGISLIKSIPSIPANKERPNLSECCKITVTRVAEILKSYK